MAPQSSTLAWKIPWMEEIGRLQSMGSLRVRHDWATSLSIFTFMHWRRKWQPIPVFVPGESQGWGSLVGCHLWGRTVRHDWSDLAAQWQQHSANVIEKIIQRMYCLPDTKLDISYIQIWFFMFSPVKISYFEILWSLPKFIQIIGIN